MLKPAGTLRTLRSLVDVIHTPLGKVKGRAERVKHLVRSMRTLTAVLERHEVLEYIRQGVGFEVVRLDATSPPQKVLVLAPHPDDEVFGCGGAIALHRERGDSVHIILLTDGRYGGSGPGLVEQRRQETRNALDVLGGADLQCWNFCDGNLQPKEAAINQLAEALQTVRPDIVYVPWFGDNHADHRAAFRMLVAALRRVKATITPDVWQYEIWAPLVPNRLIPIGRVLPKKVQAIEAHQSQLGVYGYRESVLGLNAYRGVSSGTEDQVQEPCEAFFALPTERFLQFADTLASTSITGIHAG